MLSYLSVGKHLKTAANRALVSSGFVFLSFLVIVGFGLLRKTQGAENTLRARQISDTPTKIRPKLTPSYGNLPLGFEANQGQTDTHVRFMARGSGYTIFLTDNGAVLTLRKAQPGMGRLSKFGLPSRLGRFRSIDPRGGPWANVSGALESLSLMPDLGQVFPEPKMGEGRVTEGLVSQPPQVVRMTLPGGNAKGRVVGVGELPGRTNYFIGNDPKNWRTNVPSYSRVEYSGVYPGVDLIYYGNRADQLEYDFMVGPGGDPNQIKLSFAGADGMRIDTVSGDLVLKVGADEVRLRKPAIYQPVVAAMPLSPSDFAAAESERSHRAQSAGTAKIDGAFVLASNNQVTFRVAGYDRKRALVIDPVLSYSTYLGGSANDCAQGIAVDSTGSTYVTGFTTSLDFPTKNPLQTNNNGLDYAFVTKLNPEGSALVYSTFLGGTDDDNAATGIAIDSSGDAYVTGWTSSSDFPTVNPIQNINKATWYDITAFAAKLNPAGSALVYSTYLGGSTQDSSAGIAVDSSGNAYVTGYTYSIDFPVTPGAFDPIDHAGTCESGSQTVICGTAFVAKLNADGSAPAYSTYLGGSKGSGASGIAVDSAGSAYIMGGTPSSDFPTTAGAFQTQYEGPNAFVAKFSADGSALVYSTYLVGGEACCIAVDSSGNAYVEGTTGSSTFPTLNPAQAHLQGSFNAFVTKLNPAGSALIYSTYLGGAMEWAQGIAVDPSGNAYVTGTTVSSNFPTVDPIQANYAGGSVTASEQAGDAFVTKLSPAGSSFVFSTYLGGSLQDWAGGIAIDPGGNAYVTGRTSSIDFPTVNPFQATNKASSSNSTTILFTGFVAKILMTFPPAVSLSGTSLTFAGQPINTISVAQSVTLTNTGSGPLTLTSTVVSGDFALSTTATSCPYSGGTVAANANCTIDVVFTPTATGTRSGSIVISDNAHGAPKNISLSGTGQDFTLTVSPGSSSSASVTPGQTATYPLVVGGVAGMDATVTFACSGAPSEATCSASPASVATGSSAANMTLTVATIAPSISAPRFRHLPLIPPLSRRLRVLSMVAFALAAIAWIIRQRNRRGVNRRRSAMAPLAVGLLLSLVLAACGGTGSGGGGGGGAPSNPGTPAGSYTLTVTGTAGSGSSALSHNVTLTLIVN